MEHTCDRLQKQFCAKRSLAFTSSLCKRIERNERTHTCYLSSVGGTSFVHWVVDRKSNKSSSNSLQCNSNDTDFSLWKWETGMSRWYWWKVSTAMAKIPQFSGAYLFDIDRYAIDSIVLFDSGFLLRPFPSMRFGNPFRSTAFRWFLVCGKLEVLKLVLCSLIWIGCVFVLSVGQILNLIASLVQQNRHFFPKNLHFTANQLAIRATRCIPLDTVEFLLQFHYLRRRTFQFRSRGMAKDETVPFRSALSMSVPHRNLCIAALLGLRWTRS